MNTHNGPDRIVFLPDTAREHPTRMQRGTDRGGISVLVLSDRFLTRPLFLDMLAEHLPEPYTLRVSPLLRMSEATDAMRPDIVFFDATGNRTPPEDFCARLGYRAALIVIADSQGMAQNAFDSGAIDYLVSPIRPERLLRAVQRALTWIALRGETSTEISEPFDAAPETTFHRFRWIRFVRNGEIAISDLRAVIYLRAERKNTRVVLPNSEGYVRQGINMIAARLNRDEFWRIHRSTIVNPIYIDNIFQDEIGRVLVNLKSGKGVLHVSKGYERLLLRDGIF